MDYSRFQFPQETLLRLYEPLLLRRMIEEKMLLLLRQGKISKWFSGMGQEAISVGCAAALRPTDFILPLHRNLGVFTARNVPLRKLFAQFQGKRSGFTKGRDRSFHFGTLEYNIVGMISHLGAMLGVADGLALASKLDGKDTVAAVFIGDGGTSEGDFHEAVNVAAVWKLPVLFVIEHNGYGLSTPSTEQFACAHLADKAVGYGIEGMRVDGNNILEMYEAISLLAERMRRDKAPVLLEARTFRMRGHEEASGTKYVPKHHFEAWSKKDPVINYEQYLLSAGVLTEGKRNEIRGRLQSEIDNAWEAVDAEPEPIPDIGEELADVYAPSDKPRHTEAPAQKTKKRFVDAVSDGLRVAMDRDPNLILMGQDIAEYGGVFKVTEGFLAAYGRDRVRNTPLCESAIVGTALGLSIAGRASMVEMQFADFVSCAFNQIVNNLAKTHYRWGQAVNVVIRMPTGGGTGAGPFHSQSTEAWFTHVPGLKVVYPATPYDAKGLLIASFEDKNPVLFFEHKYLYRSTEEEIPDGYYTVPIGSARISREGTDATIVTYGLGIHWAMELQKLYSHHSLEIVDLRTLYPWDKETVFASVRKTHRALVLHEDTHTGGFGGEIAATIQEELFTALDAPVMRAASLDSPIPFHSRLERNFFARQRMSGALQKLLSF